MQYVQNHRVVVIADKDKPGRDHAQRVAQSVASVAASVKVIELPGDDVKDATDWFKAGGDAAKLQAIAEAAPTWGTTNTAPAGDDHDGPSIADDPTPWPEPLAEEAYHGLVGEIVRAIEPHTEADPAALLVQTLIAYGCAIGRKTHFEADGASHYGNLFAVLVGETAKGRKGTSWKHPHRIFTSAVPAFAEDRVVEGLASGKG